MEKINSNQMYDTTEDYRNQMSEELKHLKNEQGHHPGSEKILGHIEFVQQLIGKLDEELTSLKTEIEKNENAESRNKKIGEKVIQIESVGHDAESHAKALSAIQHSFHDEIVSLDESDAEMSEEEFLKWEDRYADEYDKMMSLANNENKNLEGVADSIRKMVAYPGSGREKELATTIEARSGQFYYDRVNELKNAIEKKQQDADLAKGEEKIFGDFVAAVYEHIDFKYMDREDVREYGFERYENNRMNTHNKIIKLLNNMNNLAKKYGTRPFTPRNFWPSDLREKKNQTEAEATIFRYDRDIVEEYYAIAFPSAVRRAAAKQEREARFGIY